MPLIRLVYASRSRIPAEVRPREIGRLLDSARRLNQLNVITGFLMVTESAFAQILEGSAIAVAETYGRIIHDKRHDDIRLLAEDAIPARRFDAWSMGVAERDDTTAFIFGLYGLTAEADLAAAPVDALVELAGDLARMRG